MFSHEELPKLLAVESGNELNFKTSRITSFDIKNAMKKKKSREEAVCGNIPPKANYARRDISEEVVLELCNRTWRNVSSS